MDKIALVLMLAVTAEALVEYGKSLAAAFGGGDYKAAVLQLCAAVVGVLLCVLSGADMYAALGVPFSLPAVGMVLTGIFASRGANFVGDIIGSCWGNETGYKKAGRLPHPEASRLFFVYATMCARENILAYFSDI